MPRIAVKLKIVTGTYIPQTTRAAFNQNAVNPTFLACNGDDEALRIFCLTALRCSHVLNLYQIIQVCEDRGVDFETIDTLQL